MSPVIGTDGQDTISIHYGSHSGSGTFIVCARRPTFFLTLDRHKAKEVLTVVSRRLGNGLVKTVRSWVESWLY